MFRMACGAVYFPGPARPCLAAADCASIAPADGAVRPENTGFSSISAPAGIGQLYGGYGRGYVPQYQRSIMAKFGGHIRAVAAAPVGNIWPWQTGRRLAPWPLDSGGDIYFSRIHYTSNSSAASALYIGARPVCRVDGCHQRGKIAQVCQRWPWRSISWRA